eukprot:Skav225593  [mRNA]  locus=scaffold1527:143456:147109:+ [translate_table: standard]
MGKLWDIRTQVNNDTSVAQQLFREALEEALRRPLTTDDPGRQEAVPTTLHAAREEAEEANETTIPPTRLEPTEVHASSTHHNASGVHADPTTPSVFIPNTGGLVGFSTSTSPTVDAAFPPQASARSPIITSSQEDQTFSEAVRELPAEEGRTSAPPSRSEVSPTEEVKDLTEEDDEDLEPAPKRPKVWDMVTPDALLEHAATGPDGVSRADVILMPQAYQQAMVTLMQQVEKKHQWPSQLLDGAIHSLAKIEGAQRTGQFRPITILPFQYRNWASLRAKALLRALRDCVPPGLRGNMPGQCSMRIWYDLQSQLEACHYQQIPLTGAVGDLVKAFNQIPRRPVFQIARRLGIDEDFILTWEAAVSSISRRFYVDSQPSEAVFSHTGFPEGCPLSVVAMTLINLATHRWLEERCPRVTMISYVDNIEIIGPTAALTTEAVYQLDQFIQLLDMELDTAKTYYWSSCPIERKALRTLEVPVWEQGRDLGGHMQYVARQTNQTVASKCHSLEPLWGKLKRSRAPLAHKRRVLLSKAWPGGLHSISVVHMHSGKFTHMRASACDAIYNFKSGANSQIQLALIDDTRMDPEYFALWSAVQTFRRQSDHDQAIPLLGEIANTPPRQRKPGPLGVLVERLQQVMWHHSHLTVFVDEDGLPVDILHAPLQEVAFRIRRAWTRHVGSLHAHRHDMAGLQHVDVVLSRIDPSFDEKGHGMLRALQNGTFCTNDQLFTAKAAEDNLCKFCGANDSLQHRNLWCPATAASKAQLDPTTLQLVLQQPACIHRGWFGELPQAIEFRRALQELPDQVHQFHEVPSRYFDHDTLDLFTDGTGMHPAIPQARLVAWSVVSLAHEEDDPGHIVSAGGVPGVWQTVGRAEAMGVLSALEYVHHRHCHARLWVDNSLTVNRLRALLQDQLVITHATTDSDIWFPIAFLAHVLRTRVQVIKIDSHQDSLDAPPWKQWAFRGNDLADQAASQALQRLPRQILDTSNRLASSWKQARKAVVDWHSHLVRVGHISVTAPATKAPSPPNPISAESDPVHSMVTLADRIQHHAPRYMQFPGWLNVVNWLRTLGTGDLTAPEWVSWYELQVSLQLSTGLRGLSSKRGNANWTVDDKMQPYDSRTSTRNIAKWITHGMRIFDSSWTPKHMRPTNHRYQCWTMGLRMRWSKQAKTAVYEWFQVNWGPRTIDKISQLQHLRPADDAGTPNDNHHEGGLHRFCRMIRQDT